MSFSLFCPNSNQSSNKKGVFSIFDLILTAALQKMVYFSIFSNQNQSFATNCFFFLFFALILKKALPKKVFSLNLP